MVQRFVSVRAAALSLLLTLQLAAIACAAGAAGTGNSGGAAGLGQRIHDTTMGQLKPIWTTAFSVLAIALLCSKERRHGAAWIALLGGAFVTFVVIWLGPGIVSLFQGLGNKAIG